MNLGDATHDIDLNLWINYFKYHERMKDTPVENRVQNETNWYTKHPLRNGRTKNSISDKRKELSNFIYGIV